MFLVFTCMYFDFHLGTERRHLVCQNNQRKSFKTSRFFSQDVQDRDITDWTAQICVLGIVRVMYVTS